MDNFTIFDVLLVAGIFQGILLIVFLQLTKLPNKGANQILAILITFTTIMLFGRVALYKYNEFWLWRFAIFIDIIIFLAGPLYYSYIRRSLFEEDSVFNIKWFHFIPAGIHLAISVYYLQFTMNEYFILYKEGKLFLNYLIVEFSGLCSLTFYLFISLKLLKKYTRIETALVSRKSLVIRYLSNFTRVIALVCFCWWLSFVSTYVFQVYLPLLNYNFMWICISFLIYMIGYFALKQPEIFRIALKKEKLDRLNETEIEALKERLKFLIEEEHIYTQADLTLKQFSEKLNTSNNNLSWLLNNIYDQSFYEFINSLRLNAFIKKIERLEHKKVTILALALEVGFNSKSTFNKVFKSTYGCTPSQYIKNNLEV